ncbi:MAG: hypothetical protein AAGC60_27390 [Acidobacteriota bacterium]
MSDEHRPVLRRQLTSAVTASLVLGLLSTVGDWLWARFIPDGAIVPGIVHGVVVFVALALVLAWAARRDGVDARAARRLFWLPLAGAGIAASFYGLYRPFGYLGALLITWAAMWLAMAWLQRRARGGVEGAGRTAARGLLAAVGSGLAFWAISGIWTQPSPDGPNLLVHGAAWTFAFLPGFVALLLAQRDES